MTSYQTVTRTVALQHLVPLGGFHDGTGTLILLGPSEPGFWDHVCRDPAFKGPDPLDHWSQETITGLALQLGAKALFPFGGAPHHPFISWALSSGQAWQSPIGLLVHRDAGLLVSYRGALLFDHMVDLPAPHRSPCDTCAERPCLTACPVNAIGAGGYDTSRCKAHIDTDPICRGGCRVRLACPISQTYGRAPAQTAFHMKAFHPS